MFSADYYRRLLYTERDPVLRAAARLALIRARLAEACEQRTEQAPDPQATRPNPSPSRQPPRR